MSYLGSRIAAPASYPQGRTIVASPHLFSPAESRPPWRGLNRRPTELKDCSISTVLRGLVDVSKANAWFLLLLLLYLYNSSNYFC